jgi:alkylhydroperoxidase family enzyme
MPVTLGRERIVRARRAMAMEPRFKYQKADPASIRALLGLQEYVRKSGLDPTLVRLVEIRASQINGCGF